ncbi:pyridine nucleotide-disulfide oxidoreductase [Oceanispirochaeta crateris]|uniref:Pyridine nucleotide-disulfide oxidoreductase n=1 Tax=Oceanispirochaeta crateris TaxID=2518645 RepID=A0A5C1QI75_9SPIO|nr:FAD-dependent oxidoreductase [Oceanispirochaeta crateris]QEN07271.1 pyridine nucleotide-disulfide oxidoreductase [Oceanispirochaeta crateris]
MTQKNKTIPQHFDCIIIGTGPAGLGAAFKLLDERRNIKILMLDKTNFSTGGLRNDCKMNFSYPIGFPLDNWTSEDAESYLEQVEKILKPTLLEKQNLEIYRKRASSLGVDLLNIRQSHLGTDGGLELIKKLTNQLESLGVVFALGEEAVSIDETDKILNTLKGSYRYDNLIIAPGRQGFLFLQNLMKELKINFMDNIVDIGIRVETRLEHYPIVKDYYDPKFHFPGKVRTFCTNSGNAHVVQEQYKTHDNKTFYSVNGHAWSKNKKGENGLVNFAMLKTIQLTAPLASGHEYAEIIGLQAALLGGNKPIMQRVGDFRLSKRSNEKSFNSDYYDFEPTLKSCTPGDIALAVPSKIMRAIWKSMKQLDTIIPGVLHPSTIMYYPEIKMYANKPEFLDHHFKVHDGVYMIGDGAGTSRGITAAWASGIRAAEGILN